MNKYPDQKTLFGLIILVILLVGTVVFLSLKVVDQKRRLEEIAVNIHVAQTESAISDDIAKRIQTELNQVQDASENLVATTTVVYALSPGKAVVRENSTFFIAEYDLTLHEVRRTMVGTYDVPDSQIEYEKLPNGLYRFHAVADFTEASYNWYLYINEKTAQGLVVSGGLGNNVFGGQGKYLESSKGIKGNLTMHVQASTCDTTHTELIAGMTWNDLLAVTFSPAIKIKCDFSELGGVDVPAFFKGQEQVTSDLQSVTFPLVNGRSLVVKLAAVLSTDETKNVSVSLK